VAATGAPARRQELAEPHSVHDPISYRVIRPWLTSTLDELIVRRAMPDPLQDFDLAWQSNDRQ
jgi:hypothetical protein